MFDIRQPQAVSFALRAAVLRLRLRRALYDLVNILGSERSGFAGYKPLLAWPQMDFDELLVL